MANPTPTLHALPAVTAQPLDTRGLLLIRADTGAVAAVDARWQSFLPMLQVFRSLDDHAALILEASGAPAGQHGVLARALRELVPTGILRSSDELSRQFAGAPPEPARAPLTLCIRACDRPDALARLLDSLRANLQTWGGDWRCEIHDDSRAGAAIDRNRALAETAIAGLRLAYIGRAARRHWLDELLTEQPEDADALGWLLDGEHPLNQGRATHGLVYNQVFLRHAGQRVLLIDDDATLNAWLPPQHDWTPYFSDAPDMGPAYLTPEQAIASLVPHPGDPLAAHAASLGASLPAAVRALAGHDLDARCLAGCPLAVTPDPRAAPARVRYSLNGLLGDTGSVEDQGLLARGPRLIPEILAEDALYRRLRAAPRCAFTGTARPLLLNGNYFHHGTCAGIDLSEPIPPTLPTGRGEDTLLGSLLRFLYPRDFGLRLPFGIEHRLRGARPWAFQPPALDATLPAAVALTGWVNGLRVPEDLGPRQRLRVLSESIAGCAGSGMPLEERLRDLLQARWNDGLARDLPMFSALLARHPSLSATWRADLGALRERALRGLREPQPLAAGDLGAQAQLMERYAAALPAWMRAYEQRRQRQTTPPDAD